MLFSGFVVLLIVSLLFVSLLQSTKQLNNKTTKQQNNKTAPVSAALPADMSSNTIIAKQDNKI